MGEQRHGPLEAARGAEILAEGRQGKAAAEPGPEGDRRDEQGQHRILQPGQSPGDAALFQFIGGDLVQQLLQKPERAEPAADRAPQGDAKEQEDAQHVPAGPVSAGGQGVLQRAKGTGPDGTGTGIAVEAGDAGVFRASPVDFALEKALEMRVVQQRAVEMDESPGGGAERGPPGRFDLIQGPHTPYRFLPPCQRRPGRCR